MMHSILCSRAGQIQSSRPLKVHMTPQSRTWVGFMVKARFEFAEPRFLELNKGSGGPNPGSGVLNLGLSMMNLGSGVLTRSASHMSLGPRVGTPVLGNCNEAPW